MFKRAWLTIICAVIGIGSAPADVAFAQQSAGPAVGNARPRPAKRPAPRRTRARTALPDSRIDNKVTVLRDGKPLAQKTNVRWDFLEVAPGARAFFAQVVLVPPPGARITEISGPHAVSKPGWIRADAVLVALGAITTDLRVKFADGREETWKAHAEFSRPAFRMRGCIEAGLKVVSSDSSVPNVFFAADCTVKEDRVVFNPSVPGDLEWDVTTIFETDGKGERWKIFEISRNNLVTGDDVVATLGFRYQGRKTSFLVVQDRGVFSSAQERLRKERRDGNRARFDFGAAQFQATTPVTSAASTSPFLGGEILTKEILWGLRGTAQGRYVFPVQRASAVSFAGGAAYVLGDFMPGSNMFGAAGEYVVYQQNQEADGKSITFQHSQFGVSLFYLRMLSATAEFKIALKYNGLGGDSQGYAADLVYEGLLGQETRWGLMASFASQAAKSASGSSTFTQMFIGGNASF